MRPGALIAVALCVAAPVLAWAAEENKDLDLIPKTIQDSGSAQASGDKSVSVQPQQTAQEKLFVEDAVTLSSLRGGLVVPFPPPSPPHWRNRTSLDGTAQWDLTKQFSASLSDRFSIVEQSDVEFASRQTVRNDFREGYITWEPMARNYLEVGRINVKNGVALGFNPTDFFKTRTLVDQASLDPSVVRQNRLGTFMVHGQTIWDAGSASIAFAPKFYSPTPISDRTQLGIDPKFDRTNAANRLLLSVNYDIADLSPQALIYYEDDQTRFGLNVSRQIGQSIVAYAEWAGGRQPSLITQAIRYGKETGTLPANAPTLPPSDTAKSFRNDLAVGASWSSAAKITINMEYQYHQSGFTRQDWHNWFAIGSAERNFRSVTSELWFIRGYANDQQQPLAQQQVFLRANWTDAFVPKLDLTAFGFINPYDGSALAQVAASYYLSDAWTIGAYVNANVGGPRSERGSTPQAGSVTFQLVRYF